MNHTTKFTTIPHRKENNITKSIYKTNRPQPIAIFNAPRFVILVAGQEKTYCHTRRNHLKTLFHFV